MPRMCKDLPGWTFSTGVLRGHEGAPLVVGGVIYVHTPFPNIVYALDLDHEGKILWKFEPRQEAGVAALMCCDTVSRGLAFADGKIFLYQADTTLVALDAATGALQWSVKNGDPTKGATGTSAPFVVKDKVMVGVSGGEYGVRGYLTAYDVSSGAKVWRAYSIGPDGDTLIDPSKTTELGKLVGAEASLRSWQGDQWRIGGRAPWGRISYDPEPEPHLLRDRQSLDRESEAKARRQQMVDGDCSAGRGHGFARWVYQMTPHDQWDYDGVNEMILTDAVVDGRRRRLLTHFDRNGFAYMLDRKNGELISADKYDLAVNWASRIDMDKASKTYGRPVVDEKYSTEQNGEETVTRGVCPATVGAKSANPSAYSAETSLFYLPIIRLCMEGSCLRAKEGGEIQAGY